jgi:hypothetical protein
VADAQVSAAAAGVSRVSSIGATRRVRAAVAAPLWRELGPNGGEQLAGFPPGPYNQSGRANNLAVAPGCSVGRCTVYLTSAAGGVWRSDNALAPKPSWRSVTEDLPTLSIGTVELDPHHSRVVYVGTGEASGPAQYAEAGLGLFRSANGGHTWVKMRSRFFVNRGIADIKIDPRDSRRIYVATTFAWHGRASVRGGNGEGAQIPPGSPPVGLYRSTNGGRTWRAVLAKRGPWGAFGGVSKIVFDPARSRTLYAGMLGTGLFRSTDGGTHWRRIAKPIHRQDSVGDRFEFDISAARPNRMYLGIGNGAGGFNPGVPNTEFYVSQNVRAGSPRFTKLSSPDPASPGYTSRDFCGIRCYYTMRVTADPHNADIVYLVGSGQGTRPGGEEDYGRSLLRSTDAGRTFADLTLDVRNLDDQGTFFGNGGFMHSDGHTLVLAGTTGQWFEINDGGIHRGGDGGYANFSSTCDPNSTFLAYCRRIRSTTPIRIDGINDGLRTLQFQRVAVNPRKVGDILGGTQDNGFYQRIGNHWVSSANFFAGDGGQSAIDNVDPSLRYGTTNFQGDVAIPLDTASANWAFIGHPMASFVTGASVEGGAVYPPIEADVAKGKWAYYGLEHVWRSTNGGGPKATLAKFCANFTFDGTHEDQCGNWKPLGKSLIGTDFGTDRAGSWVAWIAQSPTNANVGYAATAAGRLFRTDNLRAAAAQVTWRRVDSVRTPTRFPTGIVVDPVNTDVIYVSYSGYAAYTPETPTHVLRVNTKADSVTDLTGNLTDIPITGMVLDVRTSSLYAADPYGVWRGRLNASRTTASWERFNGNLPQVPVYGLTLQARSHTLIASTHGRGVWVTRLR